MKIKIKISNRAAYGILFIIGIAILAVGVYGVASVVNPGHEMNSFDIQGCSPGQYLKYTGTGWECNTPAGSPEEDSNWMEYPGNKIRTRYARSVGIGITSPSSALDVKNTNSNTVGKLGNAQGGVLGQVPSNSQIAVIGKNINLDSEGRLGTGSSGIFGRGTTWGGVFDGGIFLYVYGLQDSLPSCSASAKGGFVLKTQALNYALKVCDGQGNWLDVFQTDPATPPIDPPHFDIDSLLVNGDVGYVEEPIFDNMFGFNLGDQGYFNFNFENNF